MHFFYFNKKIPKSCLLIIGEGELKNQLEDQIKSLKMEKKNFINRSTEQSI